MVHSIDGASTGSALMNTLHVNYFLAGGGLAAGSAAEAIRQRDSRGSILLVGQEVSRPYHRPPLSKQYLRRETPRVDLAVEPAGWFAKNEVQLRTGQRVALLDVARHVVTLSSGDEI